MISFPTIAIEGTVTATNQSAFVEESPIEKKLNRNSILTQT
ncbi:hypothetical protein [Vibrio sp. SS-MA-C1-2]|nr:hypothetical protein [Vibrio sp. SS-MA-C1-2]